MSIKEEGGARNHVKIFDRNRAGNGLDAAADESNVSKTRKVKKKEEKLKERS